MRISHLKCKDGRRYRPGAGVALVDLTFEKRSLFIGFISQGLDESRSAVALKAPQPTTPSSEIAFIDFPYRSLVYVRATTRIVGNDLVI